MDIERERDAMWNPDKVGIETDELVRLMNNHCDVLERRLNPIEAVSRIPRVCSHLLVARDCDPTRSRDAARDYAIRKRWRLSTPQVFTDRLGATDPFLWQGWATVRQQSRSGFVDAACRVLPRSTLLGDRR
ncbi:hypothetical protein [Streptomyces scopuliridis]|uniref:hypothetical protein n=1 Tax=Streptomyces scopuliridis TaxID=452529 RepID=UPI00343674B5